MPPPIDHPSLHLTLLEPLFFVKQLAPRSPIPRRWLDELSAEDNKKFLSITRTPEEISIAGEANDSLGIESEFYTWRGIKIAGPMEFDLTGVMSNFTTPLRDANIGIYAISTWNTDFVLVPKDKAEDAVDALKADGWKFTQA